MEKLNQPDFMKYNSTSGARSNVPNVAHKGPAKSANEGIPEDTTGGITHGAIKTVAKGTPENADNSMTKDTTNGTKNGTNGLVKPLLKFGRYLPLLILLGLAVHFFLPLMASLESSVKVLQSMTFGFVVLAMLMKVISCMGNGYMLTSFVSLGKQRLSVWHGTLIALGSYSIGLVAGGMVASGAATYRWLHRHGSEREWSAIAGILPATLITIMLSIISIFGMIYLSISQQLTQLQVIGFSVSMLPTLALVVILILGSAYRPKVERLVEWIGSHWAKLWKREYNPTHIRQSLSDFYYAWEMLRGGKWKRPMLGAVINCAFDIAALYFVFLAAGYPITLPVLLTGYGLPLLFGRTAFFLPGGLGVVESSMAAIYATMGIPDAVSVIVVLAFRLISFWLPSLSGFLAMMVLQNPKKRLAEG
ncbi:MAG: YbhN family protein [Chloroflexi bacterium]|nr:YbhN family protein [Chloroflexota bacterium]